MDELPSTEAKCVQTVSEQGANFSQNSVSEQSDNFSQNSDEVRKAEAKAGKSQSSDVSSESAVSVDFVFYHTP